MNVLRGLPDLAKENCRKCDKSKVTNYLIFPICFCQREIIFIFFYKFDKNFEIDF